MRTARHYYDRDEVQLAPLVMGWGLAFGFSGLCWYGIIRLVEWLIR